MSTIDTYGELELPEEKEDIKIVEDKAKTKESEMEFLIHKIMKKLTAGGNEDNVRLGFLLGKINEDQVEFDDVHVPEQNSDKNISYVGAYAFARTLLNQKEIVGWAEYFPNIPTVENELTKRNRAYLTMRLDKKVISIVINKKGEHKIFK